MTGSLRVQVGVRSAVYARPHRVVLGRKHAVESRFGETFWALAVDRAMSRRWFCVEDVTVTPVLGGDPEQALRVRCLSSTNSVQVWEGREPVRVQPGASYLAQGDVLFVGDFVDGLVLGARVSLNPDRPPAVPSTAPAGVAAQVSAAGSGAVPVLGRDAAAGVTVPPEGLGLTPAVRDVVLARYHGYYRLPPRFDPQPTPWERVAVLLRLLDAADVGDKALLRKALKDPQEAVTRLKQRVEALHPGWLPEASETQKSFHDHLRTILEMHRVFEPQELDAFDARYPTTG